MAKIGTDLLRLVEIKENKAKLMKKLYSLSLNHGEKKHYGLLDSLTSLEGRREMFSAGIQNEMLFLEEVEENAIKHLRTGNAAMRRTKLSELIDQPCAAAEANDLAAAGVRNPNAIVANKLRAIHGIPVSRQNIHSWRKKYSTPDA